MTASEIYKDIGIPRRFKRSYVAEWQVNWSSEWQADRASSTANRRS